MFLSCSLFCLSKLYVCDFINVLYLILHSSQVKSRQMRSSLYIFSFFLPLLALSRWDESAIHVGTSSKNICKPKSIASFRGERKIQVHGLPSHAFFSNYHCSYNLYFWSIYNASRRILDENPKRQKVRTMWTNKRVRKGQLCCSVVCCLSLCNNMSLCPLKMSQVPFYYVYSPLCCLSMFRLNLFFISQ